MQSKGLSVVLIIIEDLSPTMKSSSDRESGNVPVSAETLREGQMQKKSCSRVIVT